MRWRRLALLVIPLTVLVVAAFLSTPSALASSCTAPSTPTSSGPAIPPNGLPSTGGGYCGIVGDCAPQTSATTSRTTFAYVGSAPGHGLGSLMFMNLSAPSNQAAGVCGSGGQLAVPSGSPGNTSALSTGGSTSGPPGAPTPPPCPPPPAPPPLPAPAVVAQGIALPWPSLTISAKPFPIGLTGLPTWFWLEGFNGQPVTASQRVQVAGLPNPQPGCPGGAGAAEDVAVQAMPVAYTWQFGDHRATSGLTTTAPGVPYPQQDGAITHQYEDTSRGSGHPNGFLVQVDARFRIQFRSGNGAWQVLPATDRQATLRYPVQEAYPVIVGP
jgi:hypothetical protein